MISAGVEIPALAADGLVHAIIDTPQGSRNKYKYDEELGCFKLSRVLAAGMFFPYDFGFIPGTAADDGDPLDVMVIVETPAVVGCLMQVHLLGVIKAEQIENGKTPRNDRLIAVAATPVNQPHVKMLRELPKSLIKELEQFFVNYNRLEGREFRPIGRHGPEAAKRLLNAGIRSYNKGR